MARTMGERSSEGAVPGPDRPLGQKTEAEDRIHPDAEATESEQRQSPSGRIVYHAIMKEGDEELGRSSSALFWSGLAAGLSMGFSLIAEGLLRGHLPDRPWRETVARFGYSFGFLIVVLGRQQLFTENTLTPILPLLRTKDLPTLGHVLRLWGIVLVANLIGAAAMGLVIAKTTIFEPEMRATFFSIAEEAMKPGFATIFLRAIFAGWLIALMVWLLPYAEAAHVWVIIFITYLVGLGHFSHVIAGSIDVFTLAAHGGITWAAALYHFTLPALLGNIIGGVMLVAALNHAQVVSGDT